MSPRKIASFNKLICDRMGHQGGADGVTKIWKSCDGWRMIV